MIQKELVDAFNLDVDLNSYADIVLCFIEDHFGFKRSAIKLISRKLDKLFIIASHGISEEFRLWNVYELETRISGKVAANGNPAIVNHVARHKDTAPYAEIYEREGIRSLLSLPLATKDTIIGILNIYGKSQNEFTPKDTSSLLSIAAFAATFLDFLSERDHLKDRLNRLEQYNINLERLKSFHDLIMENIPIGVVATDVKGYVVLMNRVLERMSLLRREECLGKRWFEAFGFEGEVRKKLETSFRTSSSQFFPEIDFSPKVGSVLTIEMKTDIIRDPSGNRIGVVAIFSEIGEKKKIEREIEKMERLVAIGKLSAGVAHEIRNPLTGISGALQVVKKKIKGDIKLEMVLNRVFKEIDRLDSVVEKLHAVASPKDMTFGVHSISDVIEDNLFFIRKSLQSRNIRLIKRLEKGLKPIMMDRDAIQQVILNVMINAINSMPEGGDLTLETTFLESIDVLEPEIIWDNINLYSHSIWESKKEALSYLAIIVGDKGIGIPQTIIHRIFEAFFSTVDGGTGLGLYISGRIVKQHHGMMGVKSQKGKGSTFYILLPAKEKEVTL